MSGQVINGTSAAPLTNAQLLARLRQVDGPGSGLDADTVDGWSPLAQPIAAHGAPTAIPFGASPAIPRQRLYPDSLFRN